MAAEGALRDDFLMGRWKGPRAVKHQYRPPATILDE